MQYKKLNKTQKNIKHWRDRRNRLVQQLLDSDPKLLRREALKLANYQMRDR